jgi:hypothetical protein
MFHVRAPLRGRIVRQIEVVTVTPSREIERHRAVGRRCAGAGESGLVGKVQLERERDAHSGRTS